MYICLGLPFRHSSRAVQFINTSPKSERPIMFKAFSDIENLPDDSTEVECENIISRYTKRPTFVNKLCLADFAAIYDVSYAKTRARKATQDNLLAEENYDVDNYDNPNEEDQFEQHKDIVLKNGTVMRKRKWHKVLRYVRYNPVKDPENYYREILMLFHP